MVAVAIGLGHGCGWRLRFGVGSVVDALCGLQSFLSMTSSYATLIASSFLVQRDLPCLGG